MMLNSEMDVSQNLEQHSQLSPEVNYQPQFSPNQQQQQQQIHQNYQNHNQQSQLSPNQLPHHHHHNLHEKDEHPNR